MLASAHERGYNPMHTRPQHVMRPQCGWTRVHGWHVMGARLYYVPGVPFGQLNQQYSRWLVSVTNVRTQQCCTVQTGQAQNEGTDQGTTAPAPESYARLTLKPRFLGRRHRAGCVSTKRASLLHPCARTASYKYMGKDCARDISWDACIRVNRVNRG